MHKNTLHTVKMAITAERVCGSMNRSNGTNPNARDAVEIAEAMSQSAPHQRAGMEILTKLGC